VEYGGKDPKEGVSMDTAPTEKWRLCVPGTASDTVVIDEELRLEIPLHTVGETAQLGEMLEDGDCLEPLVLWLGQEILVDGHKRYELYRLTGRPFFVIYIEFEDRDAVKRYMHKKQMARRNLSALAYAYFRGARYHEEKKQGTRADLTSAQNAHRTTAESLALAFGVGKAIIRRDAGFAAAINDISDNCVVDASQVEQVLEVRNLLLARESGVTRERILRLTDEDAQAQRKFVEELRATGKAPRTPRGKKSANTITLMLKPKAIVRALLKHLKSRALAKVIEGLSAGPNQEPGQAQEQMANQGTKQEMTAAG
jgi:hypothetical protein